MDIDTISVEDKVFNEDNSLVLIKGKENPKLKGSVFRTENQEIISTSFSDVDVIEYTPEIFNSYFTPENKNILTICYEGPLIMVRFDNPEEYQIYNNSRHDCTGSFWGNKEEKFGDLFLENGGQKFIDTVDRIPGIAHHFMLMTPSLLTTTRIDFRNNQCIVVYLGSVSLDGTILNPSTFSPEIYYYHEIKGTNFLPTREELNGKILVPSRLTPEGAHHILTNGFDSNSFSGKLDNSFFNGECIIMRINNRKIIKFTPKCYNLRNKIAGSTPNVKNRLYTILEEAKNIDEYKDSYPLIGSLENESYYTIKLEPKQNTTKNIEILIENNNKYVEKNVSDRMNNIVLVCILSCPLTKIDLYIQGWFDYNNSKNVITKFVKEKNVNLRNGKYDEVLTQFHKRALQRLKDMAKVSKEYATMEKNGHTYVSKMEFSIRGLVGNEFGPSLYRIEKAIQYLKSRQESHQKPAPVMES